jgi:hypothetical protein
MVSLFSEQASIREEDNIDPMVLRLEDCKSLQAPPGLALPIQCFGQSGKNYSWLAFEAGQPAKAKILRPLEGTDSEHTSVGSDSDYDPSMSTSSMGELSFSPRTIAMDTSNNGEHYRPQELVLSEMLRFGAESLGDSSAKGLVLSDVSQLKADAPSFIPTTMAHDDQQSTGNRIRTKMQSPARTKLNSKASAFVPSCVVPSPALEPLSYMLMSNQQ